MSAPHCTAQRDLPLPGRSRPGEPLRLHEWDLPRSCSGSRSVTSRDSATPITSSKPCSALPATLCRASTQTDHEPDARTALQLHRLHRLLVRFRSPTSFCGEAVHEGQHGPREQTMAERLIRDPGNFFCEMPEAAGGSARRSGKARDAMGRANVLISIFPYPYFLMFLSPISSFPHFSIRPIPDFLMTSPPPYLHFPFLVFLHFQFSDYPIHLFLISAFPHVFISSIPLA